MDNPLANLGKSDKDVRSKIKRSRAQAEDLIPKWKLAMEFARGNHYAYLSSKNKLLAQGTAPDSNKPNWRVRQSHNLIGKLVESKISQATQRVPGYEVVAANTDAEAISGAHLAGKVALAGYDQWNVDRATEAAVWWATVPGEAFGMPYWDSSIGPFLETEDGSSVGVGDVRVRVFGAPEVSWEPGCQFDDSPYYVIRNARPIASVMKESGYMGGTLKPDAAEDWKGLKAESSQMVLVTEYLERPCQKHASGRHLVYANDKQIFPEGTYPVKDRHGDVVDKPCLHRLSWRIDPASDRDSGLVPELIEEQRSYNDAGNKAAEWKNAALMPQLLAPAGSLVDGSRPTDEPGSIVYYKAQLGAKPEWRQVPQIPNELFQMQDRAKAVMGFLASENDIPSQVESGKGIQALLDQDQISWGKFLEKLADWHGAMMRDCLTLVQRHYTEERIMQFRGRTGWEQIDNFRGSDLRGQTDVRVYAGSLEPRSKDAQQQLVMNYAQMGWISPEAAMAAINNGSAEKLIDSYELDISRANIIISKIRAGTFLDEPPRPAFPGEDAIDPETDEPLNEVPGWMPRSMVDNVSVHKAVFSDWFKTDDWDRLAPEGKEASLLYFRALLDIESREAERQQELQAAQAEQQGMMNAAKPDIGKPQASLPGIN